MAEKRSVGAVGPDAPAAPVDPPSPDDPVTPVEAVLPFGGGPPTVGTGSISAESMHPNVAPDAFPSAAIVGCVAPRLGLLRHTRRNCAPEAVVSTRQAVRPGVGSSWQ